MKKKCLAIFICFVMVFILFPTAAYGDIGPKPSVVIDFKGLENEEYYATLLSQAPSTGPHSALDDAHGDQRYSPGDEEYEIWNRFVSYKDTDGFYFLQFFDDCSESSQFVWGYYPPSSFKILLYFPDKDSFMVSAEIYERYAFDSYFTAYVTEEKIQAATYYSGGMKVEKSYNAAQETISLFARIAGTIAIEVIVALLFGFREKKQLLLILATNIVTQSILNILLNITNYNYGGLAFVINYIWMEVVVFAIEAVIYYRLLNRYSRKETVKKWVAPLYAAAANIASFCLGLYIAQWLPGIF